MRDLQIYYKDFNLINEKFDKEIEKLAEKHGLKFSGSGYNFVHKVRNIHFMGKNLSLKHRRGLIKRRLVQSGVLNQGG